MADIIDMEAYRRDQEEKQKSEVGEFTNLSNEKLDSIFQEIFSNPSMSIQEFANMMTAEIAVGIMDNFESDLKSNPEAIYDIICISENIKALVYRTTGVEYPVQQINDATYKHIVKDPDKAMDIFLHSLE